MFQTKLSYTTNDVLEYMNSFRRRQFPIIYYLYLASRILLPVYAVVCVVLVRLTGLDRRLIWTPLYILLLLAAVPLVTDFVLARIFLSPKLNRILDGVMFFDGQQISVSAQPERKTYSFGQITELLHSKGNQAYYLFLEAAEAEKKQKLSFILPERCFIQGDPDAFGAYISEKTGLECKEIN